MCYSLVTTKIPKRVRTTRDVERDWNWSRTESSNCQSWYRRSLHQQFNSWKRKDHNATSRIATNDERPRPCFFHKMHSPAHFRYFGCFELAIAIDMASVCSSPESDEFKLELLFFPVVRAIVKSFNVKLRKTQLKNGLRRPRPSRQRKSSTPAVEIKSSQILLRALRLRRNSPRTLLMCWAH